MTRNAYVLDDHELVIFWTQKGGNTSIVTSIVHDILEVDQETLKAAGGGRVYLNKSGFRYTYPQARDLIAEKGYKSIAMLRDPYDRIVSGFLNKFVRYKGKPLLTLDDLEPFARKLYQTIAERLGHDTDGYRGVSLYDFTTMLCAMIDARARNGEPDVDRHFNTQVSFRQCKDGFEYDHLYNLRQSGAFFAKLGDLTGKTTQERTSNVTPMQEITQPNLVHVNSLDMADIERFGRAQFDDPELRDLIQSAFAGDYSYVNKTLDTHPA